MTSITLNTLPADILLLISKYLDSTMLLNLALVDKQIYASACQTMFRSITLKAANLRADIDTWGHILLRNSAMEVVRHLRVDGGPEAVEHFPSSKDEASETDFTPLLAFLNKLSALTRITWTCVSQFPEAILDAIHHRFPSCQVHLDKLRLYSVFDTSLHAYEERLLSSPNLHTVRCGINIGHDKVFLRVLSLARNIKNLDLNNGKDCVVLPKAYLEIPQDSPWLLAKGPPSHLESLVYPGSLDLVTLTMWMNAIDTTTRLRNLVLENIWGHKARPDSFEYMRQMCDFRMLDKLDLHVPTTSSDVDENALAVAARSFLCSLRPLSTLTLSGDLDYTLLRLVLEHHGQKLRTLNLNPSVGNIYPDGIYLNRVAGTSQELSLLLSHCLLLKELSIPIPRTCGDKHETAIYSVIGSLPRLQNVHIILDARNPAYFEEPELWDEEEIPTATDFDNWDNEFLGNWAPEQGLGPRKGSTRKAFINSAIDEILVQRIFEIIDAAKPECSLSLEEVSFTALPGGYTGDGVTSVGIVDVCDIMAKHWIVRRNPRDDKRDQIDCMEWSGDFSRFETREARRGISRDEGYFEWDCG
ncbi:uncharacterized protein RCC_12307 [Ramularia collo-cygni]|uniref:F-box domain-containing protein n=1 Tax=Ramularia collo-cygni TaxID=112498 RepID=A0A2D3UME5_9PEZI|nr:uncharacterized protein RCC_12307 [Ramularia collo-cygni]CZT15201.1 uncharacterized protein RCC_12307 [Ramularia collo-cygni]